MGAAALAPERPRLELSGPKLGLALESLLEQAEELGGIERFAEALRLRSAAFGAVLGERPAAVAREDFAKLCAQLPTVRRRVRPYLEPDAFGALRARLAPLLDGRADTATADARVAAFCAAFPQDRAHRWVRDLAAELLHRVDPERYPLMCRWVWDAQTDTGALREIWHAEDVDALEIGVPDGYPTFLVLREELAQFLAANGVFRDVVWYVDLLLAHVYAGYIGEQGGHYLRTDFATPEAPLAHARRLLGLD